MNTTNVEKGKTKRVGQRLSESSNSILLEMKNQTGISNTRLLELALFYYYKTDEYKKLVEVTNIKVGK